MTLFLSNATESTIQIKASSADGKIINGPGNVIVTDLTSANFANIENSGSKLILLNNNNGTTTTYSGNLGKFGVIIPNGHTLNTDSNSVHSKTISGTGTDSTVNITINGTDSYINNDGTDSSPDMFNITPHNINILVQTNDYKFDNKLPKNNNSIFRINEKASFVIKSDNTNILDNTFDNNSTDAIIDFIINSNSSLAFSEGTNSKVKGNNTSYRVIFNKPQTDGSGYTFSGNIPNGLDVRIESGETLTTQASIFDDRTITGSGNLILTNLENNLGGNFRDIHLHRENVSVPYQQFPLFDGTNYNHLDNSGIASITYHYNSNGTEHTFSGKLKNLTDIIYLNIDGTHSNLKFDSTSFKEIIEYETTLLPKQANGNDLSSKKVIKKGSGTVDLSSIILNDGTKSNWTNSNSEEALSSGVPVGVAEHGVFKKISSIYHLSPTDTGLFSILNKFINGLGGKMPGFTSTADTQHWYSHYLNTLVYPNSSNGTDNEIYYNGTDFYSTTPNNFNNNDAGNPLKEGLISGAINPLGFYLINYESVGSGDREESKF